MTIDLVNLNWSAWLFWPLVVVLTIATFRKSKLVRTEGFLRRRIEFRRTRLGRVPFAIALALTWYFGTSWDVYLFLQVFFWVALIVAAIAWLFGLLGKTAGTIAYTASTVAVILAMLFGLSSASAVTFGTWGFGSNAIGLDEAEQARLKALMSLDIQKQLVDTNAAIKAEATSRTAEDDKIWAAIKLLQDSDKKQNAAIADLQKRVTKLETGVTRTPTGSDTTPKDVADGLAEDLVDQGWKKVRVGSVDWSKNVSDDTVGSYGARIDNQNKLRNAIVNDAKTRSHIKAAAMPAGEKARALRGDGYVPVQFPEDVCFDGNMLIKDRHPVRGAPNCSMAGDIVWVYVGTDSKAYWDASVRADCANPGMTQAPAPRGTEQSTVCPKGTDRAGQMKGSRPCNNRSTTPTPSRTTPSTGTPTPSTSTPPPTSTTTVPTTPPPTTSVKPTKNPTLHPCYPTPKPGCPTDPPSPAPSPTKPADPTPSNSPKPSYTTPATPKPTVTATTIKPPSPTRTTSEAPPSPTVTSTYVPSCPNPSNPAC